MVDKNSGKSLITGRESLLAKKKREKEREKKRQAAIKRERERREKEWELGVRGRIKLDNVSIGVGRQKADY